MGDDSVLDVPDQGGVDVRQGAGRQGQIPEAHVRQSVQHLVDHMVAAPEVMVEGDGHTVPQPCGADRLFQRGQDLVVLAGPGAKGLRPLGSGAGEGAPVGDPVDMGNRVQQFINLVTPPWQCGPPPPVR